MEHVPPLISVSTSGLSPNEGSKTDFRCDPARVVEACALLTNGLSFLTWGWTTVTRVDRLDVNALPHLHWPEISLHFSLNEVEISQGGPIGYQTIGSYSDSPRRCFSFSDIVKGMEAEDGTKRIRAVNLWGGGDAGSFIRVVATAQAWGRKRFWMHDQIAS